MKTFTKFNPIVRDNPVMSSKFSIIVKNLLKVSLLFFLLFAVSSINAATYYLTAAGAPNAHLPASWNTNPLGGGTAATNFTSNGDTFIIPSGITGVIDGNITVGTTTNSGTWQLNILGTLIINDNWIVTIQHKNNGQGSVCSLNVNGPDGKIIFMDSDNYQIISGNTAGTVGSCSFALNSGSMLFTYNANGIVGTIGSISSTNGLIIS